MIWKPGFSDLSIGWVDGGKSVQLQDFLLRVLQSPGAHKTFKKRRHPQVYTQFKLILRLLEPLKCY